VIEGPFSRLVKFVTICCVGYSLRISATDTKPLLFQCGISIVSMRQWPEKTIEVQPACRRDSLELQNITGYRIGMAFSYNVVLQAVQQSLDPSTSLAVHLSPSKTHY
jgi:hypothetical protein